VLEMTCLCFATRRLHHSPLFGIVTTVLRTGINIFTTSKCRFYLLLVFAVKKTALQ